MNYLAHSKAAEFLDDLGIAGSGIPDIRYYNFNHLHRPNNGMNFLKFVREKFAGYENLALGALNHGIIDSLSAKKGRYFAGIKNKVAALSNEKGIAAYYADLLVDIGIDHLLVMDDSSVSGRTVSAWQNQDLGKIAEVAALFFGRNQEGIKAQLEMYKGFFPRMFEAYKTNEGCAQAAIMRVNMLREHNKREAIEFNAEAVEEIFKAIENMLLGNYRDELDRIIIEAKGAQDLLINS